MKQNTICLVTILLIIHINVATAVNVNSCQTISSSGTYTLINDINTVSGDNCFDIQAHNVIFDGQGFTLSTTDTNKKAFNVDGYNNITIKNTRTHGFHNTIYVINSNSHTIQNNTVTNTNFWPIYANNVVNINIQQNNVTNSSGLGILVYGNESTIENNIITNASSQGIWNRGNNNNISYNTVTNVSTGLWNKGNGHRIEYNIFTDMTSFGIQLIENSHMFQHNTVDNATTCIAITEGNNNFVINNSITQCTVAGISISDNSGYNILKKNYMENNDDGISIQTGHNTVENNTIAQHSGYGIYLTGDADNNTFRNNNIYGATSGTLFDNTNSTVKQNVAYNNSFGEVVWTNDTMLRDVDISDDINFTILPPNFVIITNNSVYVNTTLFSIFNTTANISLFGLGFTIADIFKDGTYCTECTKYSDDPVTFNGSYFGNYTTQAGSAPTISFVSPTTPNNSFLDVNYITANVTATDINIENITINLYNISHTLVNTTSATTSPLFINITNLPDSIYYLNATAADTDPNFNTTETRIITIDAAAPQVTNVLPAENSIFNATETIEIAADVIDGVLIDTVIANITAPNGTTTIVTLTNTTQGSNTFNASHITSRLNGTYTVTIIANDTSNNINNTVYTNFTVLDQEQPIISTYIPANTSTILNNQTINISINTTDNTFIDTVIANISLSNGTIQTLILTNTTPQENGIYNVSYFLGDVSERHNLTFVVNDTSGNNITQETFFFAYEPITVNITTRNETNTTAMNISFVVSETQEELNTSQINNITEFTIPNTLINIIFNKTFSQNRFAQTIFQSTNLTLNQNKTFSLSNPTITGYLVSYGINTTYNFSSATVTVSYNNSGYTSKDDLRIDKCDTFNFTTANCISGWSDETSSATNNQVTNTFTVSVTSFSGFGIREDTNGGGNGGSGGGSGGGGGGGSGGGGGGSGDSSDSSSNQSTGTNNNNDATCTYDWICSDWNECRENGTQTRTCINQGTCTGTEFKPDEYQVCPEILQSGLYKRSNMSTLKRTFILITFEILLIILALIILFIAWRKKEHERFKKVYQMPPINPPQQKGPYLQQNQQKREQPKQQLQPMQPKQPQNTQSTTQSTAKLTNNAIQQSRADPDNTMNNMNTIDSMHTTPSQKKYQ